MELDPWLSWAEFDDFSDGGGKVQEIKKVKREEEEKEYTVDEDLTEIERAILFIKNKRSLQIHCAVEILKRQLVEEQENAEAQLLPLVLTITSDATQKFKEEDIVHQTLIANVLSESLEAGAITSAAASKHILPKCLNYVNAQSNEVRDPWLKVLNLLIPLLPKEEIESSVLPLALALGEVSKTAEQRLLCAKMVGMLVSYLPPAVALQPPKASHNKLEDNTVSLFDRAIALCQDTDHRVRACLALQLPSVAQMLVRRIAAGEGATPHQGSNGKLLAATMAQMKISSPSIPQGLMDKLNLVKEEIEELLRDEESEVREHAVEGAAALLKELPKAVKLSLAIFLTNEVKKYYNSDAPDVVWISKSIGPLVHEMWKDVDCEASVLLLNFVLSLPPSASSEVRSNLAYNLPGIILTISDLGKLETVKSAPEKRMMQDKIEKIRCIPEMLCKDEDKEVKIALIRALPGLASSSQLISHEKLFGVMELLLQEVNSDPKGTQRLRKEVLDISCSLLPPALPSISEERRSALFALVCSIWSSMQGNQSAWREELAIVKLLELSAQHVPPSLHNQALIPSLLKCMQTANPSVAAAAARTLMLSLSLSRNAQLRIETCNKLIRDWGRSSSCSRRMLFCDICKEVLRFFSKNFFKYIFIESAFEVLKDSVPNVRRRACFLMPQLRRSLQLPFDVHMLENLTNALLRLVKDKDPEVLRIATSLSQEVYQLDEVRTIQPDPQDEVKRADEESVHGNLERKIIHVSNNATALDLAVAKKAGVNGKIKSRAHVQISHSARTSSSQGDAGIVRSRSAEGVEGKSTTTRSSIATDGWAYAKTGAKQVKAGGSKTSSTGTGVGAGKGVGGVAKTSSAGAVKKTSSR